MLMTPLNKTFVLLILVSLLFQSIFCDEDTIYMNKPPCLLMDTFVDKNIIVSFEYDEGYYRAIHDTGSWITNAVNMKFLGDPSKDRLMDCYVGLNYVTVKPNHLYHYFVPCTFRDASKIIEGKFCVEIVAKLVGDIKSRSFCSQDYIFEITKTANFPTLTVTRFLDGQNGCVQPGEKVNLLASVGNMISKSQDYYYYGIGLASTEYLYNQSMLCKIEGNKDKGSSDLITCNIPDYIQEGSFSVLYSTYFTKDNKCPNNIIYQFNSLNFQSGITKLQIYKGSSYIKSTLTEISFDNPKNSLGSFNLTFSLNSVQSSTFLSFNNIVDTDIGIKLVDKNQFLISTKCDLTQHSDILNIFDLICIPENFEKETNYAIVILEDVEIGADTSQIECQYGDKAFYRKIKLISAEYDFFIIYDNDELPYLDCNRNNVGYYFNKITSIKNMCSSCSSYCLYCESKNECVKCSDGFTLNNLKQCEIRRDPINFQKFKEFINFVPHNNSCFSYGNENQLFSFKFSYIISKGESLVLQSEQYNNIIYAKNQNEKYGLNCLLEVIHNNKQSYGTCKNIYCDLVSLANCSFHEKVNTGKYEIEVNTETDFGQLINNAMADLPKIQINYINTEITGEVLDDSIQVKYSGYYHSSSNIYLCKNNHSPLKDCYKLSYCNRVSDKENGDSIFECSKSIDYSDYYNCINFETIMMIDSCGEKINGSFNYEYCPNYYSNSGATVYNLLLFLIILIFLS